MANRINPCTKKRKTVVVDLAENTVKPRCGTAQREFIEKTWKATKEDPSILKGIDWRRISHSKSFLSLTTKKNVSVDSFHVKDIFVWPHVIMPNYIPTCNRCEEKTHVDVARWSWVEHPKLLYGVQCHRCLDAVYYTCQMCGEFNACHEDTLRLDGEEITGVLNFRLSDGFAVDDEMYSFVVAHSTDTTTLTHQRITDLHSDRWVNLATMHHRAMLADKVKPLSKRGPIDAIFSDRPETPEQSKRKFLAWEHTKLHWKVVSAQKSFDVDVKFINMVQRKENRNSIGEMFEGIGKGKCQTLISKGIHSAKALLEHEGDDPSVKHRWKAIVQEHCDKLETWLACLKGKADEASTELDLHISIFGDVNFPKETENTAPAQEEEEAIEKPPSFSQLCDPSGCNCRVVSRQTINRIDMSDFQRRRPLQQAKMRAIKCGIWKLDWHYKLPSKTKVCTGHGKCFSPCKSALAVQNEDSSTVFSNFMRGQSPSKLQRKILCC